MHVSKQQYNCEYLSGNVKTCLTSISLTQGYPPLGKTSVVSYKDSWGIVVNSCVNYQKQIFIGVADINPDGQHFQIFCQFEQTKMAISRPFLIWILTTLHRIHGRIVMNACVKYRK